MLDLFLLPQQDDWDWSLDECSLSEASRVSTESSANSVTSGNFTTPTTSDSSSNEDQAPTIKGPKRNRTNRYKNAPQAVISRRRAQNRISQRAYRERKDQRIRDLEQLLDEALRNEATISKAFVNLQADHDRLVTEHNTLDPYAHLDKSSVTVPDNSETFAQAIFFGALANSNGCTLPPTPLGCKFLAR
jgi:hypothetical protein